MSQRVLVVGAGSIGERHIRCFTRTRRVQVSVCETNANLCQNIAERYRTAGAFASLQDGLAAGTDAVVICTPAQLHIPMAREAVRAGAHVLIEKPLSTNGDGISELIAEVNARSVVAGVAYVYRVHPALIAMRHAIQDGRIGEPVEVIAKCGQHFPLYRPAYRSIYYNDRATGGGAVQDALTHIVNAAEWLVGPVTRLAADVGHQVLDGVTVEDTAHVLTRHGSVMGCFSLNQHQAPNETTLTVVGTRGTARFEAHESRWRWMNAPGSTWIDEPVMGLARDALFALQAEAFLDAVAGYEPVPCSLGDARQTLAVNLAILQAADTGTWVTPVLG